MILQLEIEQFILDINSKLPVLEGRVKQDALGKVAILNRVLIELMDQEDVIIKLLNSHNNIKCNYLKKIIESKELESKVEFLEHTVREMTNIIELPNHKL